MNDSSITGIISDLIVKDIKLKPLLSHDLYYSIP